MNAHEFICGNKLIDKGVVLRCKCMMPGGVLKIKSDKNRRRCQWLFLSCQACYENTHSPLRIFGKCGSILPYTEFRGQGLQSPRGSEKGAGVCLCVCVCLVFSKCVRVYYNISSRNSIRLQVVLYRLLVGSMAEWWCQQIRCLDSKIQNRRFRHLFLEFLSLVCHMKAGLSGFQSAVCARWVKISKLSQMAEGGDCLNSFWIFTHLKDFYWPEVYPMQRVSTSRCVMEALKKSNYSPFSSFSCRGSSFSPDFSLRK